MRRLLLHLLTMVCAAILLFTPTHAHDSTDIIIDSAWATPCADNETITTIRLTIDNTGSDHPIGLISAVSPIADEVRLVDDANPCTEGMADRLIIPTGEQVDFDAMGYAIAITTTDSYGTGDPFSLTLTFDMLEDDLTSNGNQIDIIVGVPVLDAAPEPPPVLVLQPWTRPTVFEDGMDMSDEDMDMEMDMPPGGTHAVYGVFSNRGDQTLRLVGGQTDAAEFIEIHETQVEDDIARMMPIDGLEIAPGETINFEPGGYHIMLLGLQLDLMTGDVITLTLFYEDDAGEVIEQTLVVPVYDAQLTAGDTDHDHSSHSH